MGLHPGLPGAVRARQAVPGLSAEQVAVLIFGRDICGDWRDAAGREWLATNGLGGFACGTIALANTRRYHGFLVASMQPPVDRRLIVAKVEVSVHHAGGSLPLSSNEFADGTVEPRGFEHMERFEVVDGMPVWRFAVGDALVEQTIFMASGANTSYLRLALVRGTDSLAVDFKPLVADRDYHTQARGVRDLMAESGTDCCTVRSGGRPLCRLHLSRGRFAPSPLWYWNFLHREESARGLDALEDLWGPGTFTAELSPGSPLIFTASTDPGEAPAADEVCAARAARLRRIAAALPASAPPWVRSLALATDQFIVRRGPAEAAQVSIIAGYPWFTDWGRDTMIALPGLTLIPGRFEEAAAILRTYAAVIDRGMLPNRFPDAGETLEYNTADATLWMFQAVDACLDSSPDPDLLRELFPRLIAVIHAHAEGTRHGIGVDPADGLLRAGEPNIQLTWMDARQGDLVVTPRIGKPVEINALWLNALAVAAKLAGRVRNDAEMRFCRDLLQQTRASFGRFWNADRGCLYDVIDVDGGGAVDAAVRPNQLFAVSLPLCALSADQMRAVVDTCARELLTSHGLRSLSPSDPAYRGSYTGGPWQRDAAYHQGTVWAWLLGPFARAHHRVHGDAGAAQSFLEPIAQHLSAACVGSVSEVFDGDAPHTARGCFAQAWSVAEILRTWVWLESKLTTS